MQTRINLLPNEHRKKEMTPLAVLVPILVAVTLIVASGAFWAWLHFGELAQVRSHHEELANINDSKQDSLRYAANLRGETSDYKKRSETIEKIAVSRILWTKKLDELCNVVADDQGGERYLVWLENLEVKKPTNRGRKGAKKGEEVTMKGLCFSDKAPLQLFNNFHEALQQSAFYGRDFMSISNPAGKAVDAGGSDEKPLKPSRGWTMDLAMVMNPREAKKKARGGVLAEPNRKK